MRNENEPAPSFGGRAFFRGGLELEVSFCSSRRSRAVRDEPPARVAIWQTTSIAQRAANDREKVAAAEAGRTGKN